MDMQDSLDNYTTFRLEADLDALTEKQRQMLPLLIEAADIMDGLFQQQSFGDQSELLSGIDDPAIRRYIEINYGRGTGWPVMNLSSTASVRNLSAPDSIPPTSRKRSSMRPLPPRPTPARPCAAFIHWCAESRGRPCDRTLSPRLSARNCNPPPKNFAKQRNWPKTPASSAISIYEPMPS